MGPTASTAVGFGARLPAVECSPSKSRDLNISVLSFLIWKMGHDCNASLRGFKAAAHGEGSVEGAVMNAFNRQELPQGQGDSPPHCSALLPSCSAGALALRQEPSLSSSAAAGQGRAQRRTGSALGGRQKQRSLHSKQSLHTLLRLWEREAA